MMPPSIHDNQRIAKNTILLSFRMAVLMLVTLYTSRVVLDQLGVVNFGVYNVVGGIVAMLSFLNSSMTNAVQRFFSYAIGEGDSEKLNRYFNVSLIAHVLIAVVVVILAEMLGVWYLENYINIPVERTVTAHWVLHFSVVASIFSILQVPFNSMIIAKEKMGIYAYLSIFDGIFRLAIAYALTITVWDKLKLYSVMMAIVPLIVLIIYYIYCRRTFVESRIRNNGSWSILREITSLASWNVFGEISWLLTDHGVNLLINYFYGPAVNAARAIGLQVNLAVNKFVQNFQVAVNPQVIKLYAAGDMETMKKLVFQASRFSFYLLLVLSLPLLFAMDEVLALWLKAVPEKTAIFCRLFLICTLIQIIPNLLAQIARGYGKLKKYTLMVSSTIFLIFPFSFIALFFGALPEITVVIAIIAQTSLIFIRMYLIKGMIGMRYWEFSMEVIWPILKVTFVALLVPSLMAILLKKSLLVSFSLIVVSVLSAILASFFVGMTQSERDYFTKNVKKKLLNRNI